MSLSNVPPSKIKIHVKKRHNKQLSYRPSLDDLESPSTLDIYSLFSVCRYHKVIIRGDAEHMCIALKKKLFGYIYKPTPSEIVYKTFTNFFFYKLGNNHMLPNCNNTCDFYNSNKITSIPPAFLCCLTENNKTHGFDIRSLVAYRNIDPNNFKNPFTDKLFSDDSLNIINKKISWLTKFDFPIQYVDSSNTDNKLKQYTINVFSHIARYQYVDHLWFWNLDFNMLKRLYYELFEIWNYRLPMIEKYKSEMIKGLGILNNNEIIKRYEPTMCDKLRLELLKNIERLVTEGLTEDHIKTGCYIVMLGLVLVSDDAATSHPHLYQAAYMEEEF